MKPWIRLALWAGLAAVSPHAHADDIRTQEIRFAPGASRATVRGAIIGYESVSYTFGVKAGQVLKVALKASNASTSFNLYAPGRGPGQEALAIGDLAPVPNRFEGPLPEAGTYTINVFMNRAAARRKSRSTFTLDVSIPTAAAGGKDLEAACPRYAAVDFATRPSRIRTTGTRSAPEGWLVDATANLGSQGIKPFACRFDRDGRYLGILSKVDEGSL